MNIITFAILALIFAQFHPRGRLFLSSDLGAIVTITVSTLAILNMIPGLLAGQLLNIPFIAIWAIVAYQRLNSAKRFIKYHFPRLPRR